MSEYGEPWSRYLHKYISFFQCTRLQTSKLWADESIHAEHLQDLGVRASTHDQPCVKFIMESWHVVNVHSFTTNLLQSRDVHHRAPNHILGILINGNFLHHDIHMSSKKYFLSKDWWHFGGLGERQYRTVHEQGCPYLETPYTSCWGSVDKFGGAFESLW